jgi:2-oxoglutarate/2-oxoacid ferredoxin oxidoreductase subunit beta
MTSSIFDTQRENQWCPGCGNFGILSAMKQAFADQGLSPEDLMLVGGIGQAGKTPNYIHCNVLHGLHGRALPLATGAQIANHHLKIVVSSGDGDCYGEGGNHFLAAIRRNVDLTLLVHNNGVYGLTKGQASPTTALGTITKLQASGTTSQPFNPVATALVGGAGFVARSFSGDGPGLSDLIAKAMAHRGFALIDILQPCVSFNKITTHAWYRERVYDLSGTGHDPANFRAALDIALETGTDRIATGLIYQVPGTPYHERLKVLADQPLVRHRFSEGRLHGILSRA